MHRNKVIILIFALSLLFNNCVEEYDVGSIYDYEGDLSVSGWITNVPGRQVISINKSTHLSISIKNSFPGCYVEVLDDQDNVFVYNEISDGRYAHSFSEGDIVVGRSYKLRIVTPDGNRYESDYEKMLPAPSINNIKYQKESMDTREIGTEIPGLKFYTDFDASGDYAQYFKLDVWETYQFRTAFDEIYILKDGILSVVPEDSINRICYLTEKVSDIFLISTHNLTEKKIPDFPLHFVDNQSQRLLNGYSPEIHLLSLSELAYQYWENQKSVLEESGSLFETQPPSNISNIYNVEDPDETVLGYFGASEVTKTRIFVPKSTIDDFNIEAYCTPGPISSFRLAQLFRSRKGMTYLIYYPDYDGALTLHVVETKCFDCTVFPLSTTIKPDYWESE